MEAQVTRLVAKAWAKYEALPPNERLLIAISGIPGSARGKSTIAETIVRELNQRAAALAPSAPHPAVMLPMDGFHLTRAQLHAMPNAAEAVARRGAAFTFDAAGLLALVQRVRAPVDAGTAVIYAPSFDHAVKDPQEDAIAVPPTARVVVFEGLYLSLGTGAWAQVAALMDESWFIEIDLLVARARLIPRHVKAGIAANWAEAEKRVLESDERNAREIMRDRLQNVDEVIVSTVDEAWAAEEQQRNTEAEAQHLV